VGRRAARAGGAQVAVVLEGQGAARREEEGLERRRLERCGREQLAQRAARSHVPVLLGPGLRRQREQRGGGEVDGP